MGPPPRARRRRADRSASRPHRPARDAPERCRARETRDRSSATRLIACGACVPRGRWRPATRSKATPPPSSWESARTVTRVRRPSADASTAAHSSAAAAATARRPTIPRITNVPVTARAGDAPVAEGTVGGAVVDQAAVVAAGAAFPSAWAPSPPTTNVRLPRSSARTLCTMASRSVESTSRSGAMIPETMRGMRPTPG